MKANEFVKRFGLDEARISIDECKDNDFILFQHNETLESGMVDRRELKRLVESHELVEKLGGLDEAKIYVPDGYKSERLKQAIADVESCHVD